jgi:hypothetical protein
MAMKNALSVHEKFVDEIGMLLRQRDMGTYRS